MFMNKEARFRQYQVLMYSSKQHIAKQEMNALMYQMIKSTRKMSPCTLKDVQPKCHLYQKNVDFMANGQKDRYHDHNRIWQHN